MKYSKGITWINDCRIPFKDDTDIPTGGFGTATISYMTEYKYFGGAGKSKDNGRFPPNLLVCDDALNDGNITETKEAMVKNGKVNNIGLGLRPIITNKKGDKGSNSRYYDLDLWFNELINKL